MSLARAFTTRRNKPSEDASPQVPYVGRAFSQRSPNAKPIQRSQISSPVALLSTTNMLSYDAPDIAGTSRIRDANRNTSASSVSGHSLGEESEKSTGSNRSSTGAHSQDTDATSVDDCSPILPEPNHLSCYFKNSNSTSTRPGSATQSRSSNTFSSSHSRTESASSHMLVDSPMIPQRAPSHSKQAHVLSHKRSVQHTRTAGPPSPVTSSFNSPSHPFGKELEQLSEAAEEFGFAVRDAEADADRTVMQSKGLVQFCAADYMSELSSLHGSPFADNRSTYQQVAWI